MLRDTPQTTPYREAMVDSDTEDHDAYLQRVKEEGRDEEDDEDEEDDDFQPPSGGSDADMGASDSDSKSSGADVGNASGDEQIAGVKTARKEKKHKKRAPKEGTSKVQLRRDTCTLDWVVLL